jgi:stage V sporulation protein SpoVS
MAVLRISAKTNLLITTRTIAGMIHKHKYAEVQALGRFSVRRAEQAIGRAATLLEMEGIKIAYQYRTIEPDEDGNEKAGIRFLIRAVEEPISQSELPRLS